MSGGEEDHTASGAAAAAAAAVAVSDSCMDTLHQEGIADVSMQNEETVTAERVADLWQRFPLRKSFEEQQQLIRELIQSTETNVDQNDADPYGDGDQSRLSSEQKCQVFRRLWAEGADVGICVQAGRLSNFAMQCVQGNKTTVERILKANSDNRQELLEKRETSFRIPPLLLTTGLAKHPAAVTSATGRHMRDMDFEGVVHVLLKYGARPNVQDVAGKTVVHWGAGSVNTPTTRSIAHQCIIASKSARHYGKTVSLQGLSATQYNGMTGTLGGYVADSERRVVHIIGVDGEPKELSLRPKNIFHDDVCIWDESYNLVDIPDRLGSVALHEVVMNGNVDTARFLCDVHHASVDMAEVSDITPRSMVMRRDHVGGMGGNPVFDIVKARASRCHTVLQQQCSACGKDDLVASKFSRCSQCGTTRYCSRACQKAHWPSHKLLCQQKGILLSRPVEDEKNVTCTVNHSSGVLLNSGEKYGLPDGIKVDEKFWIQVQCIGETDPHHLVLNDKSCSCQFSLEPGTPGYSELFQKVKAEKDSMGTKSHFKASFNANGDCTVFPHTSTLLEW